MRFISSFLLVFGAPAFPGNACFPAGRRADLSFGLLFAPCRRVEVRSRTGNAKPAAAGAAAAGWLPVAERASPLTALQTAGTQPGAKWRAQIRTAACRGTPVPRCQGGWHLANTSLRDEQAQALGHCSWERKSSTNTSLGRIKHSAGSGERRQSVIFCSAVFCYGSASRSWRLCRHEGCPAGGYCRLT